MPSAKVRCVRIEPAITVTQQLRIDESSDLGCSAYAPSSRFSGASCTSLIPIVKLRGQPVGRGMLTFDSGTTASSLHTRCPHDTYNKELHI